MSLDDGWIAAHFKETQLARLRLGQRVEISSVYEGVEFFYRYLKARGEIRAVSRQLSAVSLARTIGGAGGFRLRSMIPGQLLRGQLHPQADR